jgi:hypothetical protein
MKTSKYKVIVLAGMIGLFKIYKYKYEVIALGGLIATLMMGAEDPLLTISCLVMVFGMLGMLAEKISPTVRVNVITNKDLNNEK